MARRDCLLWWEPFPAIYPSIRRVLFAIEDDPRYTNCDRQSSSRVTWEGPLLFCCRIYSQNAIHGEERSCEEKGSQGSLYKRPIVAQIVIYPPFKGRAPLLNLIHMWMERWPWMSGIGSFWKFLADGTNKSNASPRLPVELFVWRP